MVECHIGACEYHICHTDLGEGPFCSLGKCVKLTKEIVVMMKQSGGYDGYQAHAGSSPKERPNGLSLSGQS